MCPRPRNFHFADRTYYKIPKLLMLSQKDQKRSVSFSYADHRSFLRSGCRLYRRFAGFVATTIFYPANTTPLY